MIPRIGRARNTQHSGYAGHLTAALLLTLAILAGCGGEPRVVAPTPIPTAVPTATATATPVPTATATLVPTAALSIACTTPGVQPVSQQVIFYGDTSKRQVSLTFDSDGGSPTNANLYLNILQTRGIHATFFLTGEFAIAHPDVVRRILSDGNQLGNHTMDHPDLTNPPRSNAFICAELMQAERAIVAAGGQTSRPFFRPPCGNYNARVRELAAGLGYRTVYWSIDPRDWDPATTTQDIVNRVLNAPGLRPGAIILMHVNSPNEQYALNTIIAGLEQRGYAIVPLSQLLA
jgi:peptidoglycan/xylan/chitin deacetylase (PgdA/CDA1 family)